MQEPADTSTDDNRVTMLSSANTLPSTSALSDMKRGSTATISFKQVVQLAHKRPIESEVEQQLVCSLPSDIQVQVRTSTNKRNSLIQVIKDGLIQHPNEQLAACLQELNNKMIENNEMASRIMDLVSKNNELTSRIMDLASKNNELASENNELASKNHDATLDNNELIALMLKMQEALDAKQDEMKLLQIQALDRLALIQNSVKALLSQTYELHEYPIPRLFIVLPQDSSSWNPLDLLSNKFRLYFLCECGEHTKSNGNKIPHHIHLAKHEGYDITRPKEFFQQYGSYVLTILRMLKFGISVAGIAVPAMSLLVHDDTIAKASSSLKMLISNIQSGMDQAIGYIEKISPDEDNAGNGPLDQIGNNEALEGADLRQLESFLKSNDENRVLGNLYRTVTSEGHVKWVCIDHFRENYQEKAAIAFHDAVNALHGTFDENVGRLEVRLTSKVQADQFYVALENARSVYELKLHLNWETTQNDFKRLRNALPKTSIAVLALDLGDTDGPTSDILNRNQRYDPILGIMRHPSIQSFTIRGPRNLSKRSNLLSRNDNFSNLRHLDVSLLELQDDISGVACLIGKASNLSSLAVGTDVLGGNNGYALETYNVIAKNRTYPINFKEWNFCIPPPSPKESNQSLATEQCIEHSLKVCTIDRKKFDADLDELTVGTIAKATTNGSAIEKLRLVRDGQLDDVFVDNISSIVARSELRWIELYVGEDEDGCAFWSRFNGNTSASYRFV